MKRLSDVTQKCAVAMPAPIQGQLAKSAASSVELSSVQGGISVVGKALMRSNQKIPPLLPLNPS